MQSLAEALHDREMGGLKGKIGIAFQALRIWTAYKTGRLTSEQMAQLRILSYLAGDKKTSEAFRMAGADLGKALDYYDEVVYPALLSRQLGMPVKPKQGARLAV